MKINEKFNVAYTSMNLSITNNIENSNKKFVKSNDFILNKNKNNNNNNNKINNNNSLEKVI